MSAYIEGLKRLVANQEPRPAPQSLRDRFITWYASLPTVSRHRAFAMSELEAALATQGKYLSPVLHALGWKRERMWRGQGPYSRYWVPPYNTPPSNSDYHCASFERLSEVNK